MKSVRKRSIVLIAASVLLAGVFGCPFPVPGPEAVLEGTWELVPSTPAEPQGQHWYFTFDATGDLVQVRFTLPNSATVTWNNPPGFASVAGDQVHIATTQSGNGLTFDGTLNSATAPTRAVGTVNANLILGGIRITVSQGEATLVKQ